MSSTLKNVQVKCNLPGANVKAGPSLTKQVTAVIATATSLTDAVNQALTVYPTAINAVPTLPVQIGTSN